MQHAQQRQAQQQQTTSTAQITTQTACARAPSRWAPKRRPQHALNHEQLVQPLPPPQSSLHLPFGWTAPAHSHAQELQQQFGITPLNPVASASASSFAQVWPVASNVVPPVAAAAGTAAFAATSAHRPHTLPFGSAQRQQHQQPHSKRRKLPYFLAPQQVQDSQWGDMSATAAPAPQWADQQQQQPQSFGIGIWAPGRSASTAAFSLGMGAQLASASAFALAGVSQHGGMKHQSLGRSSSFPLGSASHLHASSSHPHGHAFARHIHSSASAFAPAPVAAARTVSAPGLAGEQQEQLTPVELEAMRKAATALRVQARRDHEEKQKQLLESGLQFMGPRPNACIPPGHVVRYAQTRAQALELGQELLDLLRVDLDERAMPGATQALGKRCQCPVAVGLDLEWRPSFVKGQAQNPVALMQIAVQGRVYLFQLVHWARVRLTPEQQRDPTLRQAAASEALGAPLATILSDARILKVGVGVLGDVAKFQIDYHIRIQGALDLSQYANARPDLPSEPRSSSAAAAAAAARATNGHSGCAAPAAANRASTFASVSSSGVRTPPRWTGPLPRMGWSLKKLVAHALGLEMSKSKKVQISNWEARPLTSAQQSYAAIDAFASFATFEALHAHHVEAGSCHEGLAVGMGRKTPPQEPHFVPVEIAVRVDSTATVTSSTATVTATSSGASSRAQSGVNAKRPFREITIIEE